MSAIAPLAPAPAAARSHLDRLEDEAIHIVREVAAEFERPVLMFSGGKDSVCLAQVARRAFAPAPLPIPLLHIDTGHNFPEVLAFRDRCAAQLGAELIVRRVDDAIAAGLCQAPAAEDPSRNRLQIPVLRAAIDEFRFDAVLGGARRDEEKSRAKERIFSFRDRFGQWDPKSQRPELWSLYNGRHRPGEHMRVFPLSNWTELDIWQYIQREGLALPGLYFAHEREVVERDGALLPVSELLPAAAGESVARRQVRFRTVGDMSCTACVPSDAGDAAAIITETQVSRVTERGSRVDDKVSEAAMEERKREGYF